MGQIKLNYNFVFNSNLYFYYYFFFFQLRQMRFFNFLFFILFISSTAVANVFQRFTLLESTDLSGISRIKTGDFEEDGGDDLIQLVGNGYAAYIAVKKKKRKRKRKRKRNE